MKKMTMETFEKMYRHHILFRAQEGNDWIDECANFSGLEIEEFDFKDINLQYADFSNCKIHNCTFKDVDLSNCNFSGASIDYCSFKDCNMVNTKFFHSFISATLYNVNLDDSEFAYTVFSGISADEISLKNVSMYHCLSESKFYFVLTNSYVRKLKASHNDFSNITIGNIEYDENKATNSINALKRNMYKEDSEFSKYIDKILNWFRWW